MKLTYFYPNRRGNVGKKATAQSTSDLSLKHQTPEISLKTSDLMLKYQTWQVATLTCTTRHISYLHVQHSKQWMLIADALPSSLK